MRWAGKCGLVVGFERSFLACHCSNWRELLGGFDCSAVQITRNIEPFTLKCCQVLDVRGCPLNCPSGCWTAMRHSCLRYTPHRPSQAAHICTY
jgi:hypothetical protein